MNTSDEDALKELRGYPGWTPERDKLAERAVGRGLGAAFDFAIARWMGNPQSSSNSSGVFVVIDSPGQGSSDPAFWDVLEPELLELLRSSDRGSSSR